MAVVCDPSSSLIIILATTMILAMTALIILLVLCFRKTRKTQIKERVSQAALTALSLLYLCIFLYFCVQGTIETNDDYGTYCDGVVYNTVEDSNDYYSTLGVED